MDQEELAPEEAVRLAAVDPLFYSRYYFPKTCRMKSPRMHEDMWRQLEGPSRQDSIMSFRDSAKTSISRLWTSKRTAFGITRTGLFVGPSQAHASNSLGWLQKAVEFNSQWAQTFGLRKGSVWNNDEAEIINDKLGITTTWMALGVTGSIRGINIDDFRPDTIVADDLLQEEDVGSPIMIKRADDLLFGSLINTLAPTSENILAKLALFGTPLDPRDIMAKTQEASDWKASVFSIFDASGLSRWPERWSTDELLKMKEAAIEKNMLDLWMKEKECKFISSATSAFRYEWLQYWTVLPETFDAIVMWIDPVPPPSDVQIAQGLRDKDWEVLGVVGLYKGKYFLLEYCMNQGHTPEWTLAKFWYLAEKWKPRKICVESIAYQRTLKWLIEQSMKQKGRYFQVDDTKNDRRSKIDRIVDSLNGVAANKMLYVHKSQQAFIDQFISYPKVTHDDVIETVAGCVKTLQSPEFQVGSNGGSGDDELPDISGFRNSP